MHRPITLQYVARHDNIKTAILSVTGRESEVNPQFLRTGPRVVGIYKSAEVVELADTPSTRIALAILYKLLIINLLPFASITSGNVPRNGQ